MKVKLSIGERLSDLMKERRLTYGMLTSELESLGWRGKVSKSTLQRIGTDDTMNAANGLDNNYRINAFVALSNYFGVTSDYLLGLSDDASREKNVQVAAATTGLSDHIVAMLAERRTQAENRPHVLKSRDDIRKWETAQEAQKTIDAINFLLSSDDGLEIVELIYKFLTTDFSFGLGVTYEKHKEGNIDPTLHWYNDETGEGMIREIEFTNDEMDTVKLPVSSMKHNVLEEIKYKLQCLKDAQRTNTVDTTRNERPTRHKGSSHEKKLLGKNNLDE